MLTFDMSNVDTTPGAGNVFSPPASFAGEGEDAYGKWLTSRYHEDLGFAQYMSVLGRWLSPNAFIAGRFEPQLAGPFAKRLSSACLKLHNATRTEVTKQR